VRLLSLFGIIIEKLFSVTIKTNYLERVLTWAVFVIAGYVQSFKGLPGALGRWQKRTPGR